MSIDVAELGSKMIAAFRGELSEQWPNIKNYAETEARKIAENFARIETMLLTGEINRAQAKYYVDIQTKASKNVLLAIQGLTALMVEQAINSALNVVKDTVNGAVGFILI